jgi:hypothetical protein|tara:strand:+ start:1211 stop:3619 length:2409 start_codon:yes stop_codon:yes gene_type:complete
MAKINTCQSMLMKDFGMDEKSAQKMLDDLKKGKSPEKILDRAERYAATKDFELQQGEARAELGMHAFEKAYNFIMMPVNGVSPDIDTIFTRFRALLTGSTKEGEGFLNSIGAAQDTRTQLMHGRIQTEFLNNTGLTRTQMHRLLRNKRFQEDLVKERFPLQKKSVTGNKEAHELAKIIEKENLRVVQEANAAGAAILYDSTHVTTQFHDIPQMKLMGEDEWIDFTMSLLDKDKTFGGFEPNREILRRVFKKITKELEEEVDATETMADALSASRYLHFEDANAWLTYNKRFGHQDPVLAMIEGLELQSDRTVLIQRLGPDPEDTYNSLKQALSDAVPQVKQLIEGEGLDKRFDLLSGKSLIPGSVTLTKITSGVVSWHLITDMGKAFLSSFSDPLIQAMTMNYYGKSFFSSYHDTFKNLKRSFNRNLGMEEQDMFKFLGIGIDGILNSSSSRYINSDPVTGTLSRWADKMFMYNGLNYWTNANREGFARMSSAFMGDQARFKWDGLTSQYQRILQQYGITESDWNLVHKIGAYDIAEDIDIKNRSIDIYANERYVTPDHIRKFSKSKQAKELANKLEIFFVNESKIAVPQPGKNEKAIMSFGFQRGTVPGSLAELFWLFRGFSLTMAVQQYPRMMQNGMGNSAMHLAPAIMLGYASLTAKDLFKGKEPRDPFDSSTAAASLIQSGVPGIVGDFVYNSYSQYGFNWSDFIVGPVASDFRDAGRIFSGIVNGEKDAAKAWSAVKNNIPYANLFYLEPVVNYGLIYHIQEYLNPGYLGRTENMLRHFENQDYIEAFRPSAVVGGY